MRTMGQSAPVPQGRSLPDEPWAAPMPIKVAASATIDMNDTGRFSPDGSLRGTIGGSGLTLLLRVIDRGCGPRSGAARAILGGNVAGRADI